MVATTDPATLPDQATWYLATNLPRPAARARTQPHPAADLAEIVRLYGLRNWVEQGYKQVKYELGWADFQVRSDQAIRRHWKLVYCAFSFCWGTWFADHPPHHNVQPEPGGGERGAAHRHPAPPSSSWPRAIRAVRAWLSPWIALQRWWTASSKAPPPRQLQELLDSVSAGHGLHLYIRD